MKQILLFFLIFIPSVTAISQTADSSWSKGGKLSLTFNQLSLTNWAAGGENSFGGNGYLNLHANYKKENKNWDNNLDLAYGMIKLDGAAVRKSEDKIDFYSKYGLNISKNLLASANVNFNTQFSDGYKYPNDSVVVSTFMAPAYLQVGIGLDYKPVKYASFSILPFTGRITFVNDQALADLGAYGVEPAILDTNNVVIKQGKNVKMEFGGALMAIFDKEIFKNVSFKSKLQLFTNYLKEPQNIDVNWDSMLSLKVNKHISSNIGISILYDDDTNIVDKDGKTGPRTQIKQTFGVGLALDF